MLPTGRSATPIRVHQFWDAIDQCSTQGSVNVEQIMTIVSSLHKVSRDELDRELEAAICDKLIVSDVIQNEKQNFLYKLPEQELTKPEYDWYCFHCHLGAGGQIVGCKDCPRIFHLDCLPDDRKPDGDLFICPPCHIMATKPSAELLNLQPKELNKLLEYSCFRFKDKGIPLIVYRADGITWAVASNREAKDKWRYDLLVYFNIDLSKMLGKAVDRDYQSLEEFQVDCETLIHGIRVYFGVEQLEGQSIAASFHTEVMEIIEEIKLCHDCFRRSNEKHKMGPWWFCLPCTTPHEVVWAKQSDYPYWPAKIMKVDGSKYYVRYFGGNYERGMIDVKNIQPIDTPLNSLKIRKTAAWNEAYEELEQFLDIAKNPEKINSLPATKAGKHVTPAKSKGTAGKRAASSSVEKIGTKKSKNDVAALKTQEDIERAEPNVDMNSHGYKLRSKDSPVLDDDYDDDASTSSIPERLKQPPAYINTQLMKIKMEEDYVPVKKESDQDMKYEIEDDNNDNSSSAQSDDEDNHEFRVLDSERGQQEEEVAVKVNKNNATKAVVNETEMKEEEEVENISGLDRLRSPAATISNNNTTSTTNADNVNVNNNMGNTKESPSSVAAKPNELMIKIGPNGPTQRVVLPPGQELTPQILQQITSQITNMPGFGTGSTFHVQTTTIPQQQQIPTKLNEFSAKAHATAQGLHFVIQANGNEVTPELLSQIQAHLTSMKVVPGQTINFRIETPEQQQKKSLQQQVHPKNMSHRLGTAPPHPSSSSSSAKNLNLTSQSKKSNKSLALSRTVIQKKLEVGMKEQADQNKTTAAVVNDAETRKRNKDLNIKGKLEERISALSQEKTEMQNKIDQLNLTNGQQQTNINALNSIITQQWTEINQLKPQVEEQKKQNEELNNKLKSALNSQPSVEIINDLNSTITLQQDENKELKSQVAEQKNQIEELNNKVKSVEDEICDLNATITLQQDESNQLKSQVAEQQTQIEELNKKLISRDENQQSTEIQNLYSTISLKQNENQGLKSQVAEQRNEIDELKIKLKCLAENQQPDEILDLNSMITLQDESNQLKSQMAELNKKLDSGAQNQQSVENSDPQIQVQIGDLPTNILSRIFDYLDINSLKESRFVCRLWKNEAGKILLKNFHLVCDDKKGCETSLVNWLKNSDTNSDSTSTPTTLKLFSGDAKRTRHLLQKFPPLSCSIRELIFSEKFTTQILYEILKLLPNLETLETKSLDLNSKQKWLSDVKSPNKLEWFVQKLKTLTKLKLDFGITKEVCQQFFRHGRELESIQNMAVHAAGMNFMSQFMSKSWNNNNWRIIHFTLDVDGHYNLGGIRDFLLAISPTLKHLKLILNSSQKRLLSLAPSVFEPWTDDWIIPLGLNRVETLEIERAVAKETFVVKCLVAALQLPRLKKLTVDDVLFGKELEEEVGKWNSHESAGGQKLASTSLEELEVFPQFPHSVTSSVSFLCHQSKIPGHPWPGLKSLKCGLNSPESFDASFLIEFRNLERLELNILLSWNHKSSHYEKTSTFNLRDLKNLKSFCLKFPENRQRYKNFANSLVEKDLKFMKSLQCVQFHRIVIDAEPLKSALGPNVAIIFQN